MFVRGTLSLTDSTILGTEAEEETGPGAPGLNTGGVIPPTMHYFQQSVGPWLMTKVHVCWAREVNERAAMLYCHPPVTTHSLPLSVTPLIYCLNVTPLSQQALYWIWGPEGVTFLVLYHKEICSTLHTALCDFSLSDWL